MSPVPSRPAEGRGDGAARAVLVVIPTTAGPVLIRSLRPRAGLPTSAAFADGDYRPLPWSGDYARLSAAGGPLSRLLGRDVPPHELRLSGSFDAGRSWEVPVCLAHAILRWGWTLTANPAAADLVLWSTGAIDLDGTVQTGDYALLEKLAGSRALIEAAPGARVAALLPAGPERREAERAWKAARPSGLTFLPGSSLSEAVRALLHPPGPAVAAAGRSGFSGRGMIATTCVAVLLAGGTLVALQIREPAPTAETRAAGPAPEPAAAARIAEMPGPATVPNPVFPEIAPPKPEPSPPPFTVEELTAPPGSSCRRVVFGADPVVRRPVSLEAERRLRASRLQPSLCGLAFRSSDPSRELDIGQELRAASVPPVRLPDGAQAYFLREGGRQDLSYSIRSAPTRGASPAAETRVSHGLVR